MGGPQNPPCGPGQAPVPSLVLGPLKCRLWANKARFKVIFSKVSQNREVSSVFVEKACHSPCFQNGCQKSPLEILRFPKMPAFSHKELMGCFTHGSRFSVKMTKCHRMCTPRVTRSGRQIPPQVTRDKLATVTCSSSDSARYSQRFSFKTFCRRL